MMIQTITIGTSIFVLSALFIYASAEDLSSCTLKKTPDEQNYCKASFAGSGTFCDMIKNGEKKRECYFMVVKTQRINTYQLKKYEPQKSEKE